MSRSLFLAITIPADLCPDETDPDEVADQVVDLLNRQRLLSANAKTMLDGTYTDGGPRVERIMVNAIPAPQWLTRETLDRLMVLAAIDPADIRNVLTAYEWHVRQDCWGPWRDRLAEALQRHV